MAKHNPKAFHKFIVSTADQLGFFSIPDTDTVHASFLGLRRVQDKLNERSSFTLIELLIVIAIIGILAAVVVLVVNPAQLVAQGRDSTRIQDLASINTALGEYLANGNTFLGSSNTVYVSVPDTSTTCSDLGLPALPTGWSYHCVSTSTLTETNGNGWIPISFSSITTGNPLPTIPIDPQNTTSTGEYYTYATNGSQYELTSYFESNNYQTQAAQSGNPDPTTYALGSNLDLTPFVHGLVGYWPLNEGSGTTAYDKSGWGNNGTVFNSPSWISGINGGGLYFTTSTQYVTSTQNGLSSGDVPITFTGWIKTPNSTIESIASASANSSMEVNRNGQLFLHECNGGDTPSNVNTSINIGNSAWHFVAISFSPTNNASIFALDGSSINLTANGPANSGGSYFTIGYDICDKNVNISYPYYLTDIRIYRTSLTPAQLLAMYNRIK